MVATPSTIAIAAPPTGAASPSPETPVPAAPPLTLSGAVAEALVANPSAVAAFQQFQQAQSRLDQVNAQQRRFQVSLTSAVSGSNADVIQGPPARETFGTLQNTLTIPIPIGGKPRFAIEQSRRLLDAARAQWDAARLAISAQIATAYYDLLRKQALRAIAQETQAQAQRQVDEAGKRFKAGDVPELDVLRANVPLSTAQAGLYQAENDVTVASQALALLLGRPIYAPVSVADIAGDTTADLALTADMAREMALASSADVRAADANVRAAESSLASVRRFRDPSLSLQLSDTRSGDETSFSREDTVQAAVTIPLSDGGLGHAQTREAEQALAQAKAEAAAARRAVETNISAAYLNAQSSLRRLQAIAAARDFAQTSYDKTLQGYTGGLFPLSDVLTAQSALRQARINYVQAVYDAAAAVTTLNSGTTGAAALPAAGAESKTKP